MANEGATKPTYSELEIQRLIHIEHAGGWNVWTRLIEQERDDYKAELARVRGLLQRQSEVLQRVASWDFDFYGDCVAEAKKLASDALSQQNSSAVVQSSGRCGDCDHLHRDHGGFNAQCTNGGHGKPRCQCLGFTER